MKYQFLGKSKLNVSAVGVGCMRMEGMDSDSCEKFIAKAFELGISPTARKYEISKGMLYTWVKKYMKDEYNITTVKDIKTVFEDLKELPLDVRVEYPYRYLGLRRDK